MHGVEDDDAAEQSRAQRRPSVSRTRIASAQRTSAVSRSVVADELQGFCPELQTDLGQSPADWSSLIQKGLVTAGACEVG